MTNSRSIASRNRLLAVVAFACALLGAHRAADAGGRKRVVVLEFEGPRSEKFHEDLVRLIKKTHTVVSADKWHGAAEELSADTLSEKNVKKVAHKLKIDAIVEGKIEKRRDEFIIRLKLRAGKSGEQVGDTIDTKAEGPRIDGRAQRDLKDELVGAIDGVESNHLGSVEDEEEEERPARKLARKDAEDDEERPAKKTAKQAEAEEEEDERPAKKTKKTAKAEDDEERPARKTAKQAEAEDEEDRPARRSGFSRRLEDERGADKTDKRARKAEDEEPVKKTAAKTAEAEDDKLPPRKPVVAATRKAEVEDDKLPPKKPVVVARKPEAEDDRLPPKKPAARPADDDDKLPPRKPVDKKVASRDDEDSAEAEAEAEPRGPLDAATAHSHAERAVDAVAGVSITMRRMSFSIRSGFRATPPGYKGIPVAGALVDATVYPLALGHKRSDQLKNIGVELLYDRVIKLSSQDPMTKMTYSTIESRFALNGVYRYPLGSSATSPVVIGSLGFLRQSFNILGPVDIPDVKYSMVPLGAGIRFPLNGKLTLAADARLLVVLAAGQISDGNQYGDATVLGFEGAVGADYLITPNIFVRAAGRIETIGFSFKGNGRQAVARDNDPMTVDVTAGRDNYFAGMATVGYIY